MIDFEKMVSSFLVEQEEPSQENIDLYNFIKGKYPTLKSEWSQKYPDVYFPSETELNTIIYNVSYGVTRFDEDYKKFAKFSEIFPLLDLIASLYSRNFKKGMDKTKAENTYSEFTALLHNKNTPAIPLDFPPQNSWTKELRTSYFKGSKTEVGNLVVEDLFKTNPNMSFYQAIHRLLELRKKVFLIKLPDRWKQISGEKFIQDVFFKLNEIKTSDPKQRISIRDEQIRKVYDDVTSKMLMDISLAAYKLYEQQVRANLSSEEVETALKNDALYKQFMGATGSKPMIWKPTTKAAPAQATQQQNNSFDQTFELSFKQMLNEHNPLPAHYQKIETPLDPKLNKNEEEKTNSTSAVRLFAGPNEGQSLYNLQKLNEASESGLDQAKNLKQQMILLGDYIKKKAQMDWTGVLAGLEKFAQAARFGAKLSMDKK